jgi:hypothetical protein
MERRLAAILAADVVGYWNLIGENQAGTVANLEGLETETSDPSRLGYGHHETALDAGRGGERSELPTPIGLRIAIESPSGYPDTQNRDLFGECRARPWLSASTQPTTEYRGIFLELTIGYQQDGS